MRSAVNQAQNLVNTAGSTAAGYGSNASNINSILMPFLTREINSPQGISQQDQTQMLSAGLGGAGGTTSGLLSMARDRAAASGNEAGEGTAMDAVARARAQAAGNTASSIAAKNAETKLNQQQQGAAGLRGMYGTDVNAQLGSLGLQNDAIKTEATAAQSGWLQNMLNIINTIKGGGQIQPAVPGGGSSAQTLMNAQNPGADSVQTTPDMLNGQFDQFGNFVSA